MRQGEGSYGRLMQRALTFLRTHPDVYFTATEVAQQIVCPTAQVRLALDTLAQDGGID
jgi:hypothetical protein